MIYLKKTPRGKLVDKGREVKVSLIRMVDSDCIPTRRFPEWSHPLDEACDFMSGLYTTCPEADAYYMNEGVIFFYKILRRRK